MARKRYWLMKSEPDAFSWDDLKACPDRTSSWDGVRNYLARNFMRDDMRVGDGVLFYHSRTDPPAVVGVARVASEAYPDPTQFDRRSKYHDPKATKDEPRWFLVDVQAERELGRPVPLPELKETKGLEDMMVTQRGARLSIQPVTAEEWKIVLRLGRAKRTKL